MAASSPSPPSSFLPTSHLPPLSSLENESLLLYESVVGTAASLSLVTVTLVFILFFALRHAHSHSRTVRIVMWILAGGAAVSASILTRTFTMSSNVTCLVQGALTTGGLWSENLSTTTFALFVVMAVLRPPPNPTSASASSSGWPSIQAGTTGGDGGGGGGEGKGEEGEEKEGRGGRGGRGGAREEGTDIVERKGVGWKQADTTSPPRSGGGGGGWRQQHAHTGAVSDDEEMVRSGKKRGTALPRVGSEVEQAAMRSPAGSPNRAGVKAGGSDSGSDNRRVGRGMRSFSDPSSSLLLPSSAHAHSRFSSRGSSPSQSRSRLCCGGGGLLDSEARREHREEVIAGLCCFGLPTVGTLILLFTDHIGPFSADLSTLCWIRNDTYQLWLGIIPQFVCLAVNVVSYSMCMAKVMRENRVGASGGSGGGLSEGMKVKLRSIRWKLTAVLAVYIITLSGVWAEHLYHAITASDASPPPFLSSHPLSSSPPVWLPVLSHTLAALAGFLNGIVYLSLICDRSTVIKGVKEVAKMNLSAHPSLSFSVKRRGASKGGGRGQDDILLAPPVQRTSKHKKAPAGGVEDSPLLVE
mmetsp:Transcript_11656/g.31337  ORF Transcript_11656/g.31337 Transcript_11656/m.31337 type:complete len:582 (-) Transcript_11656:1470-3215(-)